MGLVLKHLSRGCREDLDRTGEVRNALAGPPVSGASACGSLVEVELSQSTCGREIVNGAGLGRIDGGEGEEGGRRG